MPSSLDCLYIGSLVLGQDKLWEGESIINDLCLSTDSSSENSQIYNVTFQLLATINLTAVKLFTYSSERYNLFPMNDNSKLEEFLAQLFNEEFNLCGTTKNALIIQLNDSQKEKNAQGTKMLVYGERDQDDNSISVYAHPMIDDNCYYPADEMFIMDDTRETNMGAINEIFGIDHFDNRPGLSSSADLIAPSNRYTELEMLDRLTLNQSTPDASSDIITSAMAARKATHNRRHHLPEKKSNSRIVKSVPSKYISKQIPQPSLANSITEEKKNMIRKFIKTELTNQGKDIIKDKDLFQHIYTSVRYCYRDIVISSKDIDPEKLRVIVKMTADFYNNMDNLTRLL